MIFVIVIWISVVIISCFKTQMTKLSKNDPHDYDDDDKVRDEGPLRSFPLKENISYELGQCQPSTVAPSQVPQLK